MADTLRKLLLAGLGALDVTEEKAKAVFNDLVARGEISEKEAREVVSAWGKRAAEHRGRLQEDVEHAVQKAMAAVGVARQTEIDALKAKIADLEAKLGKPEARSPKPEA